MIIVPIYKYNNSIWLWLSSVGFLRNIGGCFGTIYVAGSIMPLQRTPVLREERSALEQLRTSSRAKRYTDAELAELGARMRAGLHAGGPEARRVLSGFVLRIDADRHGAKLSYTFPLNEKTADNGGSSGFHPTGGAPEPVTPVGCFEISWRITRAAVFPRK